MGDPAENRGLALLLASPASCFMTGGVYPVGGGALLQGPSLPPFGWPAVTAATAGQWRAFSFPNVPWCLSG
jgi:hypothetical protein